MVSRHLGKAETTRVPTDVSDSAHTVLAERGWTVHAFLGAALRALVASPDRMLALVAEHRPEGRRTGRPPRATATKPARPRAAPKKAQPVDPPASVAPAEPEPVRPTPVVRPTGQLPFRPQPKPSQRGKRP